MTNASIRIAAVRSARGAAEASEEGEDRRGLLVAGRFRLVRRIGGGAMGDVFLATHEGLGRSVAVKILRSAARASSRARFRREATIAARLSGTHVVRVTDFGELPDGSPFLVMDYVEGPTLAAELAARGTLPPDEAVGRALEVCEALAEAHRAGIVHRDIKPANLLLARSPDGSRVLRVADFGVAKAEGESTLTGDGASLGSPSYMAPEQITDPHGVDARADLWAVGVVLFELLSGNRPFDGPSVPATLLAVSSIDPPALVGVAPGLDAVVRRCLSREREARWESAASLAAALAPFGPEHARKTAERIERVANSSVDLGAATTVDPDAPGESAPGATTVTGGVTTPQDVVDQPRSVAPPPLRGMRSAALVAVTVGLLGFGASRWATRSQQRRTVAPSAALSVSVYETSTPLPVSRADGSPVPAEPVAATIAASPPPTLGNAFHAPSGSPRLSSRAPLGREERKPPVPPAASIVLPVASPVPAGKSQGTEVDDLGPRK